MTNLPPKKVFGSQKCASVFVSVVVAFEKKIGKKHTDLIPVEKNNKKHNATSQ